MKNFIKEKQLKDIIEGIRYIANSGDGASIQLSSKNCKCLSEKIEKLEEENKRLNNIINELEKELKEGSFDVYFCSKSSQKTFKSNEIIIKAMLLDKLKELKGK